MHSVRHLPGELAPQVAAALDAGEVNDIGRRVWARDAALWTGRDEGRWLGWLDIVDHELAAVGRLAELGAEVRREGFQDALLLGMGGSSLGPDVLAETLGGEADHPRLHVLDSTDPAQVRAFESRADPEHALYIVASKSGTTLEPTLFLEYFHARAVEQLGEDEAGRHFIAITDPGSKLEAEARALDFRHVLHGVPSIGGRYSVLSPFGMVPAAIMGIDLQRFLERTQTMVLECGPQVPVERNPGVALGITLGVLAANGRDKVTFIASPGILSLGAWLEQLLAESTGKEGKGLIPVDREPLAAPPAYGEDRVFVYLRHASTADRATDAAVQALAAAGQAVIEITIENNLDIGREFFRWEMATAAAGAVLRINPFDQPDVEASKVATRALTAEAEQTGSLPAEEPFLVEGGIALFADPRNAGEIERVAPDRSLAGFLRAHFDRLGAGDYAAFLAYLEMSVAHETELTAMRTLVRDAKRVATCVGFGPRFLHSTGQAYKGGPPSGVFLQITADDAADLPVPGRKTSFGTVKAAQARGDFAVLADRRRRALRVHLASDVATGLETVRIALARALA